MLGAIIGDLAGSVYEYDEFKGIHKSEEILTKDELIDENSFYSDDTILTIAILDSILNNKPYEDNLREYGLKYYKDTPQTKANHFKYMFSPYFIKWCQGKKEGKSNGNGALMRVSPIGYLFNDLNVILDETVKATSPSHDSYEAIHTAKMLNMMIYFGRIHESKEKNKGAFYPKNISLDRATSFDSTCAVFEKCVLPAFYQSNSFEDAIRTAISLGGDTDTIGAITGALAESYYEIPLYLKEKAIEKLPKEFVKILDNGYKKIKEVGQCENLQNKRK